METSALTFARPLVLHALWLAPLFAALYWWAERRRRELLGRIVAPKLRAQLTANASPARRVFRASCVLAALALLVVALAGPQMGYDTLEVPHRGRDVIIAMDVSRSMLAPDVAPSRLERAKLLAEDLIADLGADRVGLIAFAGSAFLQAPLTLDHGAVLSALDEMDTTLIPKGGTNLAAAIREAEQAFGKAEGFSRALVIISDGEELDADGVAAAKQAAAAGIRVFTVGIGSPEGSEIPLAPGEFVRDPSGKVVQSRLDAARMQQIAEAGGGFYAPLDADTAQRLVSEGIGKLDEADFQASASRQPVQRYQWPLSAAIALLALQALVGERRRRPLSAAVSLLLLGTSYGWAAPAGISAYEKGDYGQAKSAFEQRLKMEPGSANLQFNAGAAAYRLKDYSKASEYFSRAMLAEDPGVRSAAEFNLANTLFRQGQGQEDKKKKIADWKDAIAKYDAALKTRPGYTEAQENKDSVRKLLEELEKEEQKKDQQQKQDKQDQKKDQQNKNDQQKQDQQNQNKDQQKDKQDQQKQDQQNKQDRQQGGGKDDKKDQKDQQQGKDQQKQDQQGQQQKQDQQGEGKEPDQKKDQEKGQENKPSTDGGNKQDEQKQDQKDQGKGDEKDQQQGQQKEDQKQGEGKEPDQKKDQSKGGQEQKDKPQGSGDEKGQEEKDQQGSEEGNPSDARPQGQPGEKPAPVPQQTGEKKQGELRGGEQGDKGKEQAQALAEAAEEKEGEMSENQARALLRSLQGEEERVNLLERKNFQEVSRDW